MTTSTLLPNICFRPKGQLLKWVGNKFNYAEEIVSYFPLEYNKYIEPFVGTGAVLATFCPREAIAGDTLLPLIEIWDFVRQCPEKLVEHYRVNIARLNCNREKTYNTIIERYNNHPNGLDLSILSRTCYGGVVRFTKEGKMSTPMGPHKPISANSFGERVYEWRERVEKVKFLHATFESTMSLAEKGDIVYCDPPYIDSQSILYGSQKFNFNELIRQIQICKQKGASVVLSIDGRKKSGGKEIKVETPHHLFEREIFLDCGSSMLRRFQNGGKIMVGEDVHDRLLLTW